MLYVLVERKNNKITRAVVVEGRAGSAAETRNDWRTFEAAKEVAVALGPQYIATDAGSHVSPRYDVIALPKVGDEASYAFNGDSYPCGKIVRISKSLKLIVTTEGQKFYRVRETGCWKYNRTWSLTAGHVYKQNPSF
jgi:hypothetical protein